MSRAGSAADGNLSRRWISSKSRPRRSRRWCGSWITANSCSKQNKKAHSAKRKQKQIQVKEVKFRPGTEEADYQVKLRNLIRFLSEGDKAKVTLRFRGREMVHQDIGRKLLARVTEDLAPHA